MFLKTINFNVIKSIKYQLNTSKGSIFTNAYRSALRPVFIHFFVWLQREKQIATKSKNSIQTCEKTMSKL